jgi:probable HAF family extracellular repeat protein
MKRFKLLMLIGLGTALAFALPACGGGGGSDGGGGTAGDGTGGSDGGGGTVEDDPTADSDSDAIPNGEDAFPNDNTRFAAFTRILLDTLDGVFSTGVDINDNDQVVGLADDGTSIKGVRWAVDADAGTAGAPAVLAPIGENDYSAAYGNNDTGVAVGESEKDGSDFVAVLWGAGETTPAELSLSGGFGPTSAAYAINNDGQIVGEAQTDSGLVAVLWNAAGADPVSLGTLGGAFSAAYHVSDNGLIVGESEQADGSTSAVVWMVDATGAITHGPIALGTAGDDFVSSIAFGVDNFGRVSGESETAGGEIHATLWTLDPATLAASEIADLGVAGADSSAYAVNESGRIAGWDGRDGVSLASVWDTRNTSLLDLILEEDSFSQAYGLNEENLTVGVSDGQAFVAVPQQ